LTELSVVLVNYNGAAVLPQTLHTLAENTQAEQVECIVVDSGSTTRLAERRRRVGQSTLWCAWRERRFLRRVATAGGRGRRSVGCLRQFPTARSSPGWTLR